MNDTLSRFLLYGAGSCLVGALSWYGLVREVDADFATLVGAADMHARMGARIPADVDDPELLASRLRLLGEAHDYVERAARQRPDATAVWQLRGWIAMEEGHPEVAADHYMSARHSPDVDAESRRRLGTFAARALSNAEQLDRAIAVLDEDQPARHGDERLGAELLRARILHRRHEPAAARDMAVEVGTVATVDSDVAREAVATLSAFQAWDEASAVCDRAWSDAAVREYHRALLKLRAGNTDNAVRLLMSAIERGRPQIESLLEQDRELWVRATGEQALGDFLGATPQPAGPVGK